MNSLRPVCQSERARRDGLRDLRHVRVVDLLPFIARLVVIGKHESDGERMRWNTSVRECLVVASAEEIVGGWNILDS